MVEETRKVTMLSLGTDTTVPTKSGRFSILTRRMQSQLLDLMRTVDSSETDHSTWSPDFQSIEHWLLQTEDTWESKTRERTMLTKSSTSTTWLEPSSQRPTLENQSAFQTRDATTLLTSKPLTQDGGNYSISRTETLSTRKERSLMLVVDETETTKMLSYGADTMDSTSNGMLSTLTNQSHQSTSNQTSHSYSSIRCQVRDSWLSQRVTSLSDQETTVQSNCSGSTQLPRQSRCSLINCTHWLYHTLVSQETWLHTRLTELGTNTSPLTVNSSGMKEALFSTSQDPKTEMDKTSLYGDRTDRTHSTNTGKYPMSILTLFRMVSSQISHSEFSPRWDPEEHSPDQETTLSSEACQVVRQSTKSSFSTQKLEPSNHRETPTFLLISEMREEEDTHISLRRRTSGINTSNWRMRISSTKEDLCSMSPADKTEKTKMSWSGRDTRDWIKDGRSIMCEQTLPTKIHKASW